ncbi:SAF domain-containing protein [Hoeflea sp. IMCC20628]|uniref:UxaA family hydrolase n=1 Tax=Hoeflea sp. IMCC20628 TaxID=1620421 RepID=UPI00063AD618|nr:UxaA family hydrolase [Hoeflea sp. IMCC20628]AKH99234.1 SAF domain-containing protein [Hoeflea sp. IMCC20628]
MDAFLRLHGDDNVLVALKTVDAGTSVTIDDEPVKLAETIARAHKIAAKPIAAGDIIVKYGMPIGRATADIAVGRHIHVHNIRSDYTPTYSLRENDGVERTGS